MIMAVFLSARLMAGVSLHMQAYPNPGRFSTPGGKRYGKQASNFTQRRKSVSGGCTPNGTDAIASLTVCSGRHEVGLSIRALELFFPYLRIRTGVLTMPIYPYPVLCKLSSIPSLPLCGCLGRTLIQPNQT